MKKIFISLLSFILLFSLATVAYADVIIDTGDWSLAKTPSNKAWEIRSYNGSATDIELLDKYASMYVTSLGPSIFANDNNIVSVTMNSHMQGIKEYAFLNSNVSSVTLNNNLIRIGNGAFSGTANLLAINLEDSRVQIISEYTFLNSGLTQIKIPSVCNTIESGAFMNCSNLRKAFIPASVTEIAANAFDGCDNLTIYCLPNTYAAQYAEDKGINFITLGDVDGNGKVNIRDVTYIQLYRADLHELDAQALLRADVDRSGQVAIRDATYIQMYLVGLIKDFGDIKQ